LFYDNKLPNSGIYRDGEAAINRGHLPVKQIQSSEKKWEKDKGNEGYKA